jgi:hypothetical protein
MMYKYSKAREDRVNNGIVLLLKLCGGEMVEGWERG